MQGACRLPRRGDGPTKRWHDAQTSTCSTVFSWAFARALIGNRWSGSVSTQSVHMRSVLSGLAGFDGLARSCRGRRRRSTAVEPLSRPILRHEPLSRPILRHDVRVTTRARHRRVLHVVRLPEDSTVDLPSVMAGNELVGAQKTLAQYRDAGNAFETHVKHQVWITSATSQDAIVVDQYVANTTRLDPTTKDALDAAPTVEQYSDTFRLQNIDGTWRSSERMRGVNSAEV